MKDLKKIEDYEQKLNAIIKEKESDKKNMKSQKMGLKKKRVIMRKK